MQPTPTINVNRAPCDKQCANAGPLLRPGEHWHTCAAAPVPVPLSLEPWHSVTMTVVIGECDAGCKTLSPKEGPTLHYRHCSAHPVRVTYSIGGNDWASSEVTDAERADGPGQPNFTESEHMAAVRACSDRWAVVRAMLTNPGLRITGWAGSVAMYETRDAVFAEISEMARAEALVFAAQERAAKAMGELTFLPDNFMRVEPERRASAGMLERYAQRLIEQVGTL